MTEQNSCNRHFKTYLRYRIKSQRTNLVLSCILNLLALPLFIAGYLVGAEDEYSQFYYFGTFFSVVCGVFLLVLAVIGAVFSFEFYHRKDLTDTIGCLPLTYKQRFWGDFLAGYIANVVPALPFGIIAAVIASANSEFREDVVAWDIGLNAFGLIFIMGLSLFITLTFVYLFAVLITSACGKVLHSVLFTIFGTAALCGTVAGFGGCFAVGMIGDPSEYFNKAASFIPPLATLIDLSHGVGFLSGGSLEMVGGGWWHPDSDENFFTIMHAPNIVCFVILGAVITLGAYYLGKHRKTEKVGSSFAVRPMFYVISALSCAAAVFTMTVILVEGNASSVTTLSISMAAGGIMSIVSIVMYLPKRKSLAKCILCGMASIGASVGMITLLKATGSFGALYLPENVKEIEYIRVNYEYDITDKTDMKNYLKNINDILRESHDTLTGGSWYNIEYKTADGKILYRHFSISAGGSGGAIKKMTDSERTLSGYGRYFFGYILEHRQRPIGYRITEGELTYDIPEQSHDEFFETISREASEKYDPEAEIYAKVELLGMYRTFYIGENLEETIALLDHIKDTAEADPNEIVWKIDHRFEGSDSRALKINIRNKDLDDPLVKELIGLLKNEDSAAPFDSDFIAYFKDPASGTGWDYYYVPQESSKRVLEIMTELVIKELEAQAA